jgi:hypothetical protein
MSANIPLVSLLANWFSGATLLTILLDNHSHIVSNGEALPFSSHDNARYLCTCGSYLEDCPYYAVVAAHMRASDGSWKKDLFAQIPTYSRNEAINRFLLSPRYDKLTRSLLISLVPAYRRVRQRFLAAQLLFFANALTVEHASIYLDGSKSFSRARLFARDSAYPMKLIHLVRDGRAFCHSYVKNNSLGEQGLSKAANAWLNHIRSFDDFRRQFPAVPAHTLRYEDLCRSPGSALRSVFDFLGLPYEETVHVISKPRHILGNRMRLNYTGDITENLDWKSGTTPKNIASITSIMKSGLERFGYI